MTSDMEGGDKRPLTQPNQVRKIVSLTLDLSDSIIYFVDEDVANSMSPKVKKLDLRTSTVSDVMSLSGRNYPGIAAHKVCEIEPFIMKTLRSEQSQIYSWRES